MTPIRTRQWTTGDLKFYAILLSIIIIVLVFLLIDNLGAAIVGTSGEIKFAHEYYSKKINRMQCEYMVALPEGKARGTFDWGCRFRLGDKVDLDVRLANITGFVTIVGGTMRTSASQP